MFGDDFGIRPVGSAMGGGDGEAAVQGWDSDLIDIADLLGRLTWDATEAAGTTQAQAEAGFSVNGSGEMEFDSGAAIAAGASNPFTARWFVTTPVHIGSGYNARIQQITLGANDASPQGQWWFGWYYFLTAAAATPSTPGDFGSFTGDFHGHRIESRLQRRVQQTFFLSSFQTANVSEFIRVQSRAIRRAECGFLNQSVNSVRTGASYAATADGLVNLGTGVGPFEFNEVRRVKMAFRAHGEALADMSTSGNDRIHMRMPRLTLDLILP